MRDLAYILSRYMRDECHAKPFFVEAGARLEVPHTGRPIRDAGERAFSVEGGLARTGGAYAPASSASAALTAGLAAAASLAALALSSCSRFGPKIPFRNWAIETHTNAKPPKQM